MLSLQKEINFKLFMFSFLFFTVFSKIISKGGDKNYNQIDKISISFSIFYLVVLTFIYKIFSGELINRNLTKQWWLIKICYFWK